MSILDRRVKGNKAVGGAGDVGIAARRMRFKVA